ncbi:Gfo/Idh/MocA family protein [Pseudoalteromonas sp. MMG012]|uniref:Gfo/Idh/MocA family protein n=1 Tax=Pseudoalteromonas sp. MMG012 TaxID=2822686 RepID=UPI001B39D9FB|nr:Gfo/Idh/MocA family oxidoreductase [Pseudoalteromonas sp. MMG012]MBQ4850826.1 Gfo/Idh/MocA family oxidoreductase [Pseudoalteromonas sp. MMG012]
MGMVGGGNGAFIGAVHRMAASLDGDIELVCGAFSANEQSSMSYGQSLNLDPARCYASYQQMFIEEAKLPSSQKMDFVVVVTPNHLHFPVAKMALEAGFHVLSDKPATFDLTQALLLEALVEKSGRLYGLTHTYTGYPLIKQAKHLVKQTDFGRVTKVVVEYSQGWLAVDDDNKQAQWRLDPQRSGMSCCMGDIGVHAANLAEYVSGSDITAICADLTASKTGRVLDDDGSVLLQFNNGAKGVLLASQVAVGDENNLTLRVYGEHQSLQWSQLDPNTLLLKSAVHPTQVIRTGMASLCTQAKMATRLPSGHPEGYIEAFANIYRNFTMQIRAFEQGDATARHNFDIPDISDAVRGMAFIEHVVAASQSTQKWHPISLVPTPRSI